MSQIFAGNLALNCKDYATPEGPKHPTAEMVGSALRERLARAESR